MTEEGEGAGSGAGTGAVEWNVPRPATIPRATAWPAGLALGVTILAWGLVTSLIMVSAGALVVVVSLAGWIGEMRHERRQEG